eukprot:2911689-Alexandrium_andersonii.AAC.1
MKDGMWGTKKPTWNHCRANTRKAKGCHRLTAARSGGILGWARRHWSSKADTGITASLSDPDCLKHSSESMAF